MEKNFEMGLVRQVLKLMYEDLNAITRSNVEIFVSLEDYIKEYTKNEDLDVDNFSAIFLFYFMFCSLVGLLFLLNVSCHYVKRNAFRLLLRLQELKSFATFKHDVKYKLRASFEAP